MNGKLIIVAMLVVILSIGFASADVLTERYTTGGDQDTDQGDDNQMAQNITVGASGANVNFNITNVSFRIRSVGNPGIMTVVLKAVNATGMPTGSALSTGTNNTAVNTSTEWINFSMSNYQLVSGTKYVLILSSVKVDDWYRPQYDDDDATYTGGNRMGTGNGGNSWNIYGGSSMMFQVFGNLGAGGGGTLLSYNSSTNETAYEGFILNVSDVTYTPTNAKFIYAGTEYIATVTSNGDDYHISRNIDIPVGNSSNLYSFSWDIGGDSNVSSNFIQTVDPIDFALCNTTIINEYINVSFRDEDDSSWINGLIDSSTWNYYIGSGSTYKTYSFSNATNNTNYLFCFSDNSTPLNINGSVQFSQAGYPQRRWDDLLRYTSASTSKVLWLLRTADGLYTTFQVLSASDQTLQNVFVNATRSIEGTNEIIGSGYTDSAGTITFWVNPDYSHTFTFDAVGYTSSTYTVTPTQSTYTVYLSSESTSVNISDFSRGISYEIFPTGSSLNNNTEYEFVFNLTSSYWNLDSFGFTLGNGSDYFLGNNSATGTGGNVSLIMDVGVNSTIVMEYYYIVNGNQTNWTRSWYITEGDYGLGISTFFKDLITYTNDGIFGLNEFSRTLIIFLIIFLLVGVMAYNSGVYSPAAIVWMIFVMVALFDFGAGLIPNPVGAVPNFPTILTLFVAIGLTIREVAK